MATIVAELVAGNGDNLSPNSATVAEIGEVASVDRA